jgi:hypothetical protein
MCGSGSGIDAGASTGCSIGLAARRETVVAATVVSNGVNGDGEQDAPVTSAQPHSSTPLSALTSPTPVSANASSLESTCARVAAVSLRHWRAAADVKRISFTKTIIA